VGECRSIEPFRVGEMGDAIAGRARRPDCEAIDSYFNNLSVLVNRNCLCRSWLHGCQPHENLSCLLVRGEVHLYSEIREGNVLRGTELGNRAEQ